MDTDELILSVEEVAFAIGVLGGSETATGFLLGILGQRPQVEMEGRLLAAAHGLVARGYLEFDASLRSYWLLEPLQSIITPLVQSEYSLRCSRVQNGQESIATLYVSTTGAVLYQLYKSVASSLRLLSTMDQALKMCWNYLQLADTLDEKSEVLATISEDLLDSLRQESQIRTVAETAGRLVSQGLADDRAEQLAQDLHTERARSSIVRLNEIGDEVVSNHGFLILKGDQRNWFFRIDPIEPTKLHIFPGTLPIFQQLFDSLSS